MSAKNANVHVVSDANFGADVLQANTPVLVDFWAEWCQPCRMIMGIIDEVADQYVGRLKVTKVNVDESPETPVKYGVRGIPSLLIFRDGQVVGTHVGALSKAQLTAFIDEHLD
jgi:thioredoxin 1